MDTSTVGPAAAQTAGAATGRHRVGQAKRESSRQVLTLCQLGAVGRDQHHSVARAQPQGTFEEAAAGRRGMSWRRDRPAEKERWAGSTPVRCRQMCMSSNASQIQAAAASPLGDLANGHSWHVVHVRAAALQHRQAAAMAGNVATLASGMACRGESRDRGAAIRTARA